MVRHQTLPLLLHYEVLFTANATGASSTISISNSDNNSNSIHRRVIAIVAMLLSLIHQCRSMVVVVVVVVVVVPEPVVQMIFYWDVACTSDSASVSASTSACAV